MSNSVLILSAQRTPIGKFQGSLKTVPATQLGSIAIQAALEKGQINPSDVDACIMGQVLTAGCGQSPARQAMIGAGLPNHVRSTTIGKVCGSGLKAVTLGASEILLNHAQVVVCGGQENMSRAPYLLPNARDGFRMGNKECIDSMISDGLWDPYNQVHMGICGEECAAQFQITREAQDAYAIESYRKAKHAQETGFFYTQIVPVDVMQGKTSVKVEKDEEPFASDLTKLTSLRPAFDKNGTITAGNASKINDGGAAIVLASEEYVNAHSLKPMAKIISWGEFAQEPKMFTTAPIGAMENALKRANLSIDDIDLFEINEAFSVVVLAIAQKMNLDLTKVNVNGGACALGHPIGASGARVLTTLLYALRDRNKKYGLATLCIGGGEGIAVIIENISA